MKISLLTTWCQQKISYPDMYIVNVHVCHKIYKYMYNTCA